MKLLAVASDLLVGLIFIATAFFFASPLNFTTPDNAPIISKANQKTGQGT